MGSDYKLYNKLGLSTFSLTLISKIITITLGTVRYFFRTPGAVNAELRKSQAEPT